MHQIILLLVLIILVVLIVLFSSRKEKRKPISPSPIPTPHPCPDHYYPVIPPCYENNDCPPKTICYQNDCIPGCRGDSDCLSTEVCIAGTCFVKQCSVDADCPSGHYCKDYFCEPLVPSGPCISTVIGIGIVNASLDNITLPGTLQTIIDMSGFSYTCIRSFSKFVHDSIATYFLNYHGKVLIQSTSGSISDFVVNVYDYSVPSRLTRVNIGSINVGDIITCTNVYGGFDSTGAGDLFTVTYICTDTASASPHEMSVDLNGSIKWSSSIP